MSIDSHSTNVSVRPSYPKPSFAQKTAMALVAVLASSTLLGGVSFMFEIRSHELAMATGVVRSHPSANGLVVRKVEPGSRG